MRTTLDALPTEVGLEIVRLSSPDLCSLRLVSKHLNQLVYPILFSEVNLTFKGYERCPRTGRLSDFERCTRILVALATQSTNVFEHTTKLSLHPQAVYDLSSPLHEPLPEEVTEANKALKEHIYSAVSSLKNVRQVVWAGNLLNIYPSTMLEGFFRAIATMSKLEDLYLHTLELDDDPPKLFLQPLPALRKLMIEIGRPKTPENLIREVATLLAHCPNVQHLDIRYGSFRLSPGNQVAFHDFFIEALKFRTPLRLRALTMSGAAVHHDHFQEIIHYLQQLDTLTLLDVPNKPFASGPICHALKDANIFLKQLSFGSIGKSSLSYLCSYSGLELLRLAPQREDIPWEIPDILPSIIHSHHRSLRKLELGSILLALWSSDHSIKGLLEALEECTSLRELTAMLDITPDDVDKSNVGLINNWLHCALRLPSLVRLTIRPARSIARKPPPITFIRKSYRFVRGVIEVFRETHDVKFSINDAC